MSLQLVVRSLYATRTGSIWAKKITPACFFANNGHADISRRIPVTCMATTAKEQMDEYWQRNLDLKRPVSPHLQIYSPQLTSMLSITHRITGCVLAAGISFFSLAMLIAGDPFHVHLEAVRCLSLPSWYIGLNKLLFGFCFWYHFVNGIRHLIWDTVNFLSLSGVYTTGYIMLAIVLLLTLYTSFLV